MAALVIAMAAGLGACSLPTPGCDLTIGAIGDVTAVKVGDTLPADALILALPQDIDPFGGAAATSPEEGPSIDIRLRPEAAQRLAIHTAGHIGEGLVLAIGGTVVAVPMILSTIDGGSIRISGPGNDPEWLARFEGCVPAVLIPPG